MSSTDIVDLIGRTVSLKKRGKDYVGLCPFHNEKSPSFHVSPGRQFFFCYGCKKGGDAITFVKERDRIEFMDALKSLAADAGIPIPKFGRSGGDSGEATDEQVCREACSSAAMFFEQMLAEPAIGQAAREYVESRGLSADTVRNFRLGFAPDGWDHLLKGPVGRKFKPEQLVLAGLAKQRDPEKGPGVYDAFRNRLMFPIRDLNGRVIAFGGRILPGPPPAEGKSAPAKYLNSPETPAFHKGKVVYGLDQARQRIVETKTAIVVEGYADVVMAHQFGATNVVSPLGTALTENQVGLIRRFAERIVLLFDRDEAGDVAVAKAINLFLTQPVSIAIADLGEDLDPDEYLLKYGLEAWDKLIAAAPEALAFKWRQLQRQFLADDANNLTGQQNAVEAYLELIAQARSAGPVDPIRWGLVVGNIAKLTGIPADQLQRRLIASRSAPKRPVAPVVRADEPEPVADAPVRRAKPAILSARDRSERWLLGVLLLETARWHHVQTHVSPDDFTEPCRRRLAEVYWNVQRDEGEPVFNEFLALLETAGDSEVRADELRELAFEVTQEVETVSPTDPESMLASAIQHLHDHRQTQEKHKLIATIRRTGEQKLGETEEVDLLRKLQEQVRKPPSGRQA